MLLMRKPLKTATYGLLSLVFCAEALAIAPDSPTNRYQAIPERNAFGLKPPPAVDAAPPTSPSIPKLLLTGITTVLGNKLVLMKALPQGNAPGQVAKEESLMLTEGQRQGNVEVLNIDEKAGSVRVNNSGSVLTLTFEKDGEKLTNAPPPPGVPPGLPLPTNATAPTALPARGSLHRPGSFPTREIRSSGVAGPGQTPGQTNAMVYPGAGQVPSGANPAPANNLPAGLTPEEQAIVLQLQQQSAAQSGAGATQGVVPGAPASSPQPPVLPQ